MLYPLGEPRHGTVPCTLLRVYFLNVAKIRGVRFAVGLSFVFVLFVRVMLYATLVSFGAVW